MSTTTHQLLLLADHLKLSLLERQRAITLNLEPSKQDGQISRSLVNLQEGIERLESQQNYTDGAEDDADLGKLKRQYSDLYSQFHGSAPPTRAIQEPNDPALAEDFNTAQTKLDESGRSRNVRFRDDPDDQDDANRAALFAEQSRYRDDEPAAPDQSQLDNQQIHSYHRQVLQEQDEQLETLGRSVGRQRMLGIQMGNELEEQAEMLDDVESGVDRHSSTLERARKKLGTVARKSRDNWSWVTIGILIIVLILLIKIL